MSVQTLRDYRMAKGLTLREVARGKITVAMLSLAERGYFHIYAYRRNRIAKLYGLSLDEYDRAVKAGGEAYGGRNHAKAREGVPDAAGVPGMDSAALAGASGGDGGMQTGVG